MKVRELIEKLAALPDPDAEVEIRNEQQRFSEFVIGVHGGKILFMKAKPFEAPPRSLPTPNMIYYLDPFQLRRLAEILEDKAMEQREYGYSHALKEDQLEAIANNIREITNDYSGHYVLTIESVK